MIESSKEKHSMCVGLQSFYEARVCDSLGNVPVIEVNNRLVENTQTYILSSSVHRSFKQQMGYRYTCLHARASIANPICNFPAALVAVHMMNV